MPGYLTATIALFAATPALAQITSGDQAALDRARTRGELIYWYDQAAWHGTDDMLAKARVWPRRSAAGSSTDRRMRPN